MTDTIRRGHPLPGGIEAVETARSGEVVYLLPDQRAVAVGDVLLGLETPPAEPSPSGRKPRGVAAPGANAKPRPTSDPLRLCPARWLGRASLDDLGASLRPLLDLPVERVLVSHGEPVLADGRAALEAALA